jgi:hypothetical protein
MNISESKSYHSSSSFFDQEAVPSLFTIVQDEIETLIPSKSNGYLSKKISKRYTCDLN